MPQHRQVKVSFKVDMGMKEIIVGDHMDHIDGEDVRIMNHGNNVKHN